MVAARSCTGTEPCVYLGTKKVSLPIVKRWENRELLEIIFFLFPKKNMDGEVRLETLGDALTRVMLKLVSLNSQL